MSVPDPPLTRPRVPPPAVLSVIVPALYVPAPLAREPLYCQYPRRYSARLVTTRTARTAEGTDLSRWCRSRSNVPLLTATDAPS